MVALGLDVAVLEMGTRLGWAEDVSAHWAGIVRAEPLNNASTAYDMPAERKAYCVFGEAGDRVHGTAFFHADDALLVLVGSSAVLDL